MRPARVVVAVLAVLVLAGCTDETTTGTGSTGGTPTTGTTSPAPALRTLTPLPQPPDPPLSGTLIADMRQSSRDAALGRIEVWIHNDTAEDVTPTRIRYRDDRFRAPIPGERLRLAPAGTERGFPLALPPRPACTSPATGGTVQVTVAGETTTLPVEDPTDVVGRYLAIRCEELAVARVADLSWSDTVVDGDPEAVAVGDDGTLTLVVRPTGTPGSLRIRSVSGTPVLAAVGAAFWSVEQTVGGTDPVTRIELPLKPNRCDPHAFLESGGATAFRIALDLDGTPSELILRMSTAGAAAAIDFAQRSCGLTG